MEIYHTQKWSREPQFASFWAHYQAVYKWRQEHQRIAQLSVGFSRRNMEKHKIGTDASTSAKNQECEVSANTNFVVLKNGNDFTNKFESRTTLNYEEEEMSKEMKEFFQKTIEHRKQRDASRAVQDQQCGKLNNEDDMNHWFTINNEDYVLADKIGVYGIEKRSFAAPDELGKIKLRREEARRMYGEAAEKILAMETLLDMRFNQEYENKKPPLWPNIPLKL